jgi:ATP-binding cassette subfamily C protein LapB
MTEVSLAPAPSVASAAPNYLADPDLSRLLSRLAALHGHSVPAHRFGMLEKNRDGVPLAELPRPRRAEELWVSHFPGAHTRQIRLDALRPTDFPLLWLSADDQRVLLLRGRLSSGAINAEDAAGEPLELSAAMAREGQLWQFAPTAGQPADNADPDADLATGPKTAGDWFAFSIRRYRSVFMEAVFATLVVSTIGLVSAMYTMQVYDRVLPSKGYATLWVLTVGALIAIGLELMLKLVRTHMVDKACKHIDQELSAVFFGKALDIRMDARPRTVGTFAAQIRHFESVRNFMTSSTLFVLADAPFALLFVGVIALIAGPVAWVPVIMVPLAVLAGFLFRGPIERYTAAHMEESNRKNGLLIEAVDGIESVKAANAEWKLLDRWRQLTATMAQSELRMRGLSSLATHLTQTIQQLSYVGLVAAGAYAITAGHLTMGGLIACTIISGRALSPLAQIPNLIVQWKHAQIALKSLDGIMALPSDRSDDARLVVPEACRGDLRLEKVAFAYGDNKPVLEVPALRVQPGERIAVLGAVGSGKTTLVKLLSGLFKPSTGTVFLDGVDITQLAPAFVREHVGYLPQDVRLFQGTLRDNLTLGLPMPSDTQILRAAAMTGLDQVIQNHPKGLELEIAEGGRGLSGGQRQLVGITRLLLMQPRIMLLDEPTASMDAQLEGRVMHHLFKELAPDSVLVIVTHKPAFLPLVQRVVVVDRGRIVLDGPRDQVLERLRAAATQAANPAAKGEPA